jgi:hypothetical protein
MWRCFQLRKARLIVVALAWLAFRTSDGQAQQNPALPAGWQQMSPTDFAAAIRTLLSSDTFKTLSPTDQESAKEHGLGLFLKVDVANTSLNYQTVEMLHWCARYLLDPDQVEKTKTALLARQDNWAGQPYAEIRAKVVMMMRLDIPPAVQIAEARRWVQAGGTMGQVPKPDLQFDIVRQVFADLKVLTGSFTVQWTGSITAPQTGNYTFFVSPINVNCPDPNTSVSFTTTVSVGGNVVLSATPTKWVSQSSSVTLTAGQPAAVQVNASAIVLKIPDGELHYVLSWQGPGISRSVVPASSFTTADGSPGLTATYTWKSKGQPQSTTRTEPVIDVAWTNSAILLPQNTSIASQASDELWQVMTSSDFLASLAGPPITLHPFLKDPENAAAGLTTPRRQTFLSSLLSNSALLASVSPKQIVPFYQCFRIGGADNALDVFGAWAAQNADLSPPIEADRVFDGDTRNAFRHLAIYTTQELPDQIVRLQNDMLQLPDGRCSLPVAYTLAFSYLGRGKLAAYTAFLDDRLQNGNLAGDVRVNWLIARAMAQEIRLSPANPYFPADAWPMDGRPYLDTALQAAVTPPVKVRVLREIVARLANTGQFQVAKNFLQQSVSSLPSDQQAVVQSFQTQLDGLIAAAGQYKQKQDAASRQAYIKTLTARQAEAAQKGDTAAVNRYQAIISALNNQ